MQRLWVCSATVCASKTAPSFCQGSCPQVLAQRDCPLAADQSRHTRWLCHDSRAACSKIESCDCAGLSTASPIALLGSTRGEHLAGLRATRWQLAGTELYCVPVAARREKDYEPWLSGKAGLELLNPAAENMLQRWPVSKRVNSSRASDDDPTLIDAVQCRCAPLPLDQ